jgi:Tfp pilus assembly protein PilF
MPGKTRREQLEEMLAESPEDAFLRYGLAMEHVSAGDDETALRLFRELFAIDPGYVPAYLQAGRACERLGRSEEAGGVFRQGIAVAQQKGDLHALEEMRGFLAGLDGL